MTSMSESERPSADKEPEQAVALRYEGRGAPRVTAKGHGPVAQNIVEIARENGIPLYEDAELARFLGRVELEEEIPVVLYRAVAEVIAFAYRMAERSRR